MDRTTFDPGPLADATVRSRDDGWTLVFVRDLRHPIEKVWAALTEPGQLAEWSPYTADRDLGHVGEATLIMIDGDTSEKMQASVTRAERPTLLECSWDRQAQQVRWELAPTATGTRLTLLHTLKDRDWVPKVAAGWHLCLVVAEHLLDGDPIGPIRGSDARNYGWDDLNQSYADMLGIPATDLPDA